MGLQISHQYSCIFVHIPKTAGSSIESSTIFRDSRRVKNSACGHASALLFQALFPDEFKTYFKFAFVRNPWDRLVSSYFHFREEYGSQYESIVSKKYLKKYDDFFIFCKDFVNEEGIKKIIHLRPQYDYISNENDEIIVDFVGRFENIQKDFAFACNRIGASCNLTYKRKSKHRH